MQEYGLIYKSISNNPAAKKQYVWDLQHCRRTYENESSVTTMKRNDRDTVYSIEDKSSGITYYNFNCWTFKATFIEELGTPYEGLEAMECYVNRYNEVLKKGLFDSFSFSHASIKLFRDRYMNNKNFYCGNKGNTELNQLIGSGSDFADHGGFIYVNRKYLGRVIHNVKSYDYNSAYAGSLVNDKFPKNEFVEVDPREAMFKTSEGAAAFFLFRNGGRPVVKSSVEVKREMEFGTLNETPRRAWVSESPTYLDQLFRNAIQRVYNERVEFKAMGETFRAMQHKGMLEALYGWQLGGYQNKEHFGCPAVAQFAHDYVKDRLIRAIEWLREKGCEVIAADTDSIKYIGDVDLPVSDKIGEWKFEGLYENFFQAAPKSYCYTIEGKCHITSNQFGKEERLDYEEEGFDFCTNEMRERIKSLGVNKWYERF